jgi:hypothetical protein
VHERVVARHRTVLLMRTIFPKITREILRLSLVTRSVACVIHIVLSGANTCEPK